MNIVRRETDVNRVHGSRIKSGMTDMRMTGP